MCHLGYVVPLRGRCRACKATYTGRGILMFYSHTCFSSSVVKSATQSSFFSDIMPMACVAETQEGAQVCMLCSTGPPTFKSHQYSSFPQCTPIAINNSDRTSNKYHRADPHMLSNLSKLNVPRSISHTIPILKQPICTKSPASCINIQKKAIHF